MTDFLLRLLRTKKYISKIKKAKATIQVFDVYGKSDAIRILKKYYKEIMKDINYILKNRLCNPEDQSVVIKLKRLGWTPDPGILGISKIIYDLDEETKIIVGLVCKEINERGIDSFDKLDEKVFIILVRPINPKILKL